MEMNRKTKIGAAVAGAVVLAVAVGAAGAVAAQRALDAREESQAVIDDAAGQLGVEPSELTDALKEALKNRVDEAVESGRLTEERGAELKERIESGKTPLIFPGFGRQGAPGHRPGSGHFGFGHFGHAGKLDAAAEYLGLTEDELRDRLRDGDTLAEIAKAEGKPVDGLVDALVADATDRIDEAVENGRLTEEQATELKEGLEARTQDRVEGELRARPFGGFRHGFGGPGPFSDRSRSGPKA
jgi:polyhydroxyalkanoate synthesis regulator phasin